MKTPSDDQVHALLTRYNPWWNGDVPRYAELPERSYFQPFLEQVTQTAATRAVVLLGARRVGKTVMLHQLVTALLKEGWQPHDILYASVDNPLLHHYSLADLLEHHRTRCDTGAKTVVLFDEVQYQRDWDVQLKTLVDLNPDTRFVVTGSAAAALNIGSRESGAGRFSHFYLPALLFHEFLILSNQESKLDREWHTLPANTALLNAEFINYLNYGAFPEAAHNPDIGKDAERYLGRDVVEKVLQSDLPALYGIDDTRELNHLFSTLAFNTGQEVTPEGLSKRSGVSKTTLLKYIDYLESAFLIKRINRVDRGATRFKRQTHFKVYLQNPALYTAIYSSVTESSTAMGALAETAVFQHWTQRSHNLQNTYYARWKGGEVDLVTLDPATQQPAYLLEVKWSDAYIESTGEPAGLLEFMGAHQSVVWSATTTRAAFPGRSSTGRPIVALPTSVACLHWGLQSFEHQLTRGDWSPPC